MRGRNPLTLLSLTALGAAGCSIEIDLDRDHRETGGYRFDHQGVRAERHEQGEFAAVPAAVTVENRFGSIEVETATGAYGWSWDGAVWAEDSTRAEAFLSALRLRVEHAGDHPRLIVELPESDRELHGVESNLRLRLPAAAAATLRNEFGDTRVHALQGRLELHNRFGAVDVRDGGDFVAVQNGFGPIQVDGAGAVYLRNEHGTITARAVRGKAEVHNGFGAVELDCSGPEVLIENEFGVVNVELRGSAVRQVRIENSFGPLELRVPDDLQAGVRIDNNFGEVETFLDLPDLDQDMFATRMQGGSSDAVLQLQLRNEHGSIRLRRGSAR